MRAITTLHTFSRYITFPVSRMSFSSQVRDDGSIPKVYQDWQYCKMITNQLKNNNTNQSLSLLFQSYLNSRILDIQIYHQIYQKLSTNNYAISYYEILYEIYREHFPPHSANWMQKLTYSSNEQLISKLRKDYQDLGLTFPQRSPRAIKREAKKQLKVQKTQQNINKQSPTSNRRSKINKKSAVQHIPNIQLPNIEISKDNQAIAQRPQMKQKISSQIRDALSQLSLDINSFSKIIVHDIQINMNTDNHMQDNTEEEQQVMHEQQEEYEEDEMGPMGLYGLDINQIKIGRVQFIKENIKDQ